MIDDLGDQNYEDCDISEDTLSEACVCVGRLRGALRSAKMLSSLKFIGHLGQSQDKLFKSHDQGSCAVQSVYLSRKEISFKNFNKNKDSTLCESKLGSKNPSLKSQTSGMLREMIRIKEEDAPLLSKKQSSTSLNELEQLPENNQSYQLTMKDVQNPREQHESFI
ncbi:unnamed protein product [Moneuplotes crassus]|uniref:Uncharacterized protein n=1 Tax=Euplotes crassus TaxID=5936 RepID=A0AAD1TZ19_EUPCR|nr:unnamed protein product [Moneuplotes crassus]